MGRDIQLHDGPGHRGERMGATAVDVGAVLATAGVALAAQPGPSWFRVHAFRVLIKGLGRCSLGLDRVIGHPQTVATLAANLVYGPPLF
jgi:hypothetical protein